MLTFKLLRRPRRSIIPIEAEPDAAAVHQPLQKASTHGSCACCRVFDGGTCRKLDKKS